MTRTELAFMRQKLDMEMYGRVIAMDFVSPDETQHNLPLPVPVAPIEKPTKRIDEMTFADYQRGVAAVFDTYKLGN